MLPFPVSPTEDKKADRSAATHDKERKDENQVPGRGVDGVAYDGGSHGGISPRIDAGGQGQSTSVSGINKERRSGSDQRLVGSAVELQAGARPLVSSAGDRARRRRGGLYARNLEGKGHDSPGGGSGARRQENRRRCAGDGSRPHPQSAGAGTPRADKPFRISGKLAQAFCREPRDDGRFSENHHWPARSRDGKPAGKDRWVRVCSVHR